MENEMQKETKNETQDMQETEEIEGKKAGEKQSLSGIAKKKRYFYLVKKLHSEGSLSKQEISELEAFESLEKTGKVVKTAREVARYFSVTDRTIYRWKKDGMPQMSSGEYDLEAIDDWYVNDYKNSGQSSEKTYWEIKIRQYRAELLNLELEKAKGNLLDREEVEQGRVRRILIVKHAFLALPSRMAPILAMKTPLEIQELLYEAIADVIGEFSGEKKADG